MTKSELSGLAVEKGIQSSEAPYVLYWMQAAQRIHYNPAFKAAYESSLETGKHLLTVFCLDETVAEANLRHYHFMLQGLIELAEEMKARGLAFHICLGGATEIIPQYLQYCDSLFCDRGYLNWQKQQRETLCRICSERMVSFYEYDTEAVVPVHLASVKEEYSAATLRPKLLSQLSSWLQDDNLDEWLSAKTPPAILEAPCRTLVLSMASSEELLQNILSELHIDKSLPPSPSVRGGRTAALHLFNLFVQEHLRDFAALRSNPSLDLQSGMSPYLHFGQISARELLLICMKSTSIAASRLADLIRYKSGLIGLEAGLASFAEELVVRRDLSFNFCWYNPNYDIYSSLPNWAQRSLEGHLDDKRPSLYSLAELEQAQTGDPYWNAAQRELQLAGKMHNYMRMYWGKKIIEWSTDPETAFYSSLYLNNRYSLDGRDPNSYAGVAWCFGKHDRPWQEREVFGKVRYMNSAGLERKFNMQAYIQRVKLLENL